jgi:caffeoyl-CoA O-methyltransferase
MPITDPAIESYISQFLTAEDKHLTQLDRKTNLSTLAPRMLSGHLQGNFLSIISALLKPKRILEIGTFTGYSSICLAEGLTEDGMLYTLEIDEETSVIAQDFINRSPNASKIKVVIGEAQKIIPTLEEEWDLVFIDADKEAYPKYYDMVIDRVRSGGAILIDNVLWSGKVTDQEMDKKTKILHELNQRISQDPRVKNVILPLRDGLNLVLKK